MKRNQLEAWVSDIVHELLAGRYREDTRVEFKTKWPEDGTRTARRIAGHANFCSPDSILWIMGVNEKARCLVPLEHGDAAPWFQSIQTEFDEGVWPDPMDLQVPVEGGSVHAILFETDRAPYVVKNAFFGQTKGEGVQREVPWREGTSIRSAHRRELLRLLADVTVLPDFDVVSAWAQVPTAAPLSDVRLVVQSLVLPRHANESIAFVPHRCTGSVRLGSAEHPVTQVEIWRSGEPELSGRYGVVVERAAQISIGVTFRLGERQFENTGTGSVRLVLPVVRANNPAVVELRLAMQGLQGNYQRWELQATDPTS